MLFPPKTELVIIKNVCCWMYLIPWTCINTWWFISVVPRVSVSINVTCISPNIKVQKRNLPKLDHQFVSQIKESRMRFIARSINPQPYLNTLFFFHSPIFGLNLIIELLNVQFPPLQQQIRQTANLSRMNTLRALTHPEKLWVLPTVSNRTVWPGSLY